MSSYLYIFAYTHNVLISRNCNICWDSFIAAFVHKCNIRAIFLQALIYQTICIPHELQLLILAIVTAHTTFLRNHGYTFFIFPYVFWKQINRIGVCTPFVRDWSERREGGAFWQWEIAFVWDKNGANSTEGFDNSDVSTCLQHPT